METLSRRELDMMNNWKLRKSAIVKVTPDLRIIAFDEESGGIITWGVVDSATWDETMIEALKFLGYERIRTQA